MLLIKPIHTLYFHCLALSMLTVHTLLPMENPYKNMVREVKDAIQTQDQSVELLEQLVTKYGNFNTLVARYQQREINGNSPLHFAAAFCSNNTEKYTSNTIACAWLLDHGISVDIPNTRGMTSLHKADTPECAELLISRGANIEAKEQREGYTPLHFAVLLDNLAVVIALLKRNANVNSKLLDGGIPLHLARSAAIAQVLVNAGADVHAQQQYMGEPIHNIAHFNTEDPQVFEVLLQAGVEINTPGHGGHTALHHAVQGGNENSVRWLLEHGASANIANKDPWGNCYKPRYYAEKDVEWHNETSTPDEIQSASHQKSIRILELLKKYENQ